MEREIYIFDIFTQEMAQPIVKQLMEFDRQSNEPIKIYINSYGGSVTSLFSILDTIGMLKSPVYTIAIGEADSAAAVLLSAGAKRFVTKNSRVMIHEVSSWTIGTSTNMQEELEQIARTNDRLIKILAKNTKQPEDKIRADVKKTDYWMTAEEAVAYGIADQILDPQAKDIYKLSEPVSFGQSEIKLHEKLSEVQLLKTGKFQHIQYGEFEITPADLVLFKQHFDAGVRGIDISVDCTHDNDNGEHAAEGWIKAVEIRNNELWALVEFTAHGKDLVAQKRFKYFSPEFLFVYKDEQGQTYKNVLLGGTLTNRPFIKGMSAIKLSEPAAIKENKTMDKDALIAKLAEHGINVPALIADASRLKTELASKTEELSTANAKVTQLEAEKKTLSDKNTALNEQMESDAKTVAFDKLKRDGKVVEANRKKILDQFKNAKEMEAFYADMPALLKTEPTGDDGKNRDDAKNLAPELIAQAKKYGMDEKDLAAAQTKESK